MSNIGENSIEYNLVEFIPGKKFTIPADYLITEMGKYGFIVRGNNGYRCYSYDGERVSDEYGRIFRFENGLAIVRGKRGYYGLIDENFNEVVPIQFSSLDNYGNYYVANRSSEYSDYILLDASGKPISESPDAEPINYCDIGLRREGLRAVCRKYKNRPSAYGYINEYGKEVIPCEYPYADYFSNGLARVEFSTGKCGFIDKDNNIVIPGEYKWVTRYSEGFFAAKNEEGLYGYFNKERKQITPYKYRYAGEFKYGYAFVSIEENIYGVINDKGEEITPFCYREVTTLPNRAAYTPVKNMEGKWGFVNKEGEVIPCQYKAARHFSEGIAAVENFEDKWGFIDESGRVVVPFIYDAAFFLENGLAVVIDYKRGFGAIDKDGNEIIPCKYAELESFSHEGIATYKESDASYFGYIDKKGNIITPCIFPIDYDGKFILSDFYGGYAQAMENIYINKKGQEIVRYIDSDLGIYEEGLFVKRVNGKKVYTDNRGREVIKPLSFELETETPSKRSLS